MDERSWLTSKDPAAMLVWLCSYESRLAARIYSGPPSERKLRLFADTCREHFYGSADNNWTESSWEGQARERDDKMTPFGAAHAWATEMAQKSLRAGFLRDIVGNPFRPAILPKGPRVRCQAGCDEKGEHHTRSSSWKCRSCAGEGVVPSSCVWLTWNDGAVPRLAEAIYKERDFSQVRLSILADTLEEAGCTDEAILRHLRGWEPYAECPACARKPGSPELCPTCLENRQRGWMPMRGPHVRGCWAIDLLAGKH